jgi:hypothetical protein
MMKTAWIPPHTTVVVNIAYKGEKKGLLTDARLSQHLQMPPTA